jgi:hypothetical protein
MAAGDLLEDFMAAVPLGEVGEADVQEDDAEPEANKISLQTFFAPTGFQS